jgi:hypothetical protein
LIASVKSFFELLEKLDAIAPDRGMDSMQDIAYTVYKRDHAGKPVYHYTGRLVARGETWLCLEAHFGRSDTAAPYVTFRQGDRMVEWFYIDRWYNIFQLHDVDDDHLKGWYCNITRPAVFSEDSVAADDLALDVFITPSGEIVLDDEDEYRALLPLLPEADRAASTQAVEALRARVSARAAPFDAINP